MFKTHLYIARHGQTSWNAERRIQGRREVSLDDAGREQARVLGKELAAIPLNAIYSSILKRAKETAEIVAAFHNLEVMMEQALAEAAFGAAEGMTLDEFHLHYQHKILERDSLSKEERFKYKIFPEEESGLEIIQRVLPCLQKIAQSHKDGHIAIITHGWVMRFLLSTLEGYDERSVSVSNGALLHFATDGENFRLVRD